MFEYNVKLHPRKDGIISLDLCCYALHFFSDFELITFFCRTFVGGTWIDSLEAVECEKTDPEVRYRIYFDDLDRI